MYAQQARRFDEAPLRVQPLPAGDAGTFATVDAMRELIADAQGSPLVRRVGEALAGGPDTVARRALALRAWMDRHFVFVPDPTTHELLVTPLEQLRQITDKGAAFGDCDDAAVLAGALGRAGGLPMQIVLYGFGAPRGVWPRVPLSHVFMEVPVMNGAIDLDVTRPAQVLTRPSRVVRVGV